MNRWILAVGCFLAIIGVARADNWPQWRGPDNTGISKETKLPTVWGEKKNVAWKLALPGMGGSTPVIWGERIFLTSADGNKLVVLCASTDGKEIWRKQVGKVSKVKIMGDEGNEASASPCTDGKHVWAFVASGDIACLDFDGNVVWKFNVQDRYGKFSIYHGLQTSPLLHEDRIYLSLQHSNAHWVVALDKATGNEIWKAPRPTDAQGESEQAYSSPILWSDGKDAYLVILGADYCTAHSLKDGSEIWRVGELNPKSKYSKAFRIIASPVATPDLIVVPTCRGEQVIGVKPGAKGKLTPGSAGEQWRKAKGAPDVPSPLVHEGLVYLCREVGAIQCLDAKTGNQLYLERLHNARYRASPVYADGKIYLTSRDGHFSVIKAGPKFELLAENTLPDDFSASPAISNGRIYLRGFEDLYAIEEKGK